MKKKCPLPTSSSCKDPLRKMTRKKDQKKKGKKGLKKKKDIKVKPSTASSCH